MKDLERKLPKAETPLYYACVLGADQAVGPLLEAGRKLVAKGGIFERQSRKVISRSFGRWPQRTECPPKRPVFPLTMLLATERPMRYAHYWRPFTRRSPGTHSFGPRRRTMSKSLSCSWSTALMLTGRVCRTCTPLRQPATRERYSCCWTLVRTQTSAIRSAGRR